MSASPFFLLSTRTTATWTQNHPRYRIECRDYSDNSCCETNAGSSIQDYSDKPPSSTASASPRTELYGHNTIQKANPDLLARMVSSNLPSVLRCPVDISCSVTSHHPDNRSPVFDLDDVAMLRINIARQP